MTVHVGELHSEVAPAAAAGGPGDRAEAPGAAEVLGQDVTRWQDARQRAEALCARLAAEGFDD